MRGAWRAALIWLDERLELGDSVLAVLRHPVPAALEGRIGFPGRRLRLLPQLLAGRSQPPLRDLYDFAIGRRNDQARALRRISIGIPEK